MRARQGLSRDRGAAAVEFALVLPLLFVLLFGIIQYGYGFFQIQAAQATARETARRAALGVDSCTGVANDALVTFQEIVEDAARGNGMALDDISSRSLDFDNDLGTDDPPARGDTLTVAVTYEPGLEFPLVPYPDSITRRASTTVEDVGALAGTVC